MLKSDTSVPNFSPPKYQFHENLIIRYPFSPTCIHVHIHPEKPCLVDKHSSTILQSSPPFSKNPPRLRTLEKSTPLIKRFSDLLLSQQIKRGKIEFLVDHIFQRFLRKETSTQNHPSVQRSDR